MDVERSYVDISVSKKKDVKSAGWLVEFKSDIPENCVVEAFTTSTAGKTYAVSFFNSISGEDRKRLPWSDSSTGLDTAFDASYDISARGKAIFRKD
jgi:hypothetical protein